MTHIIRIEDDYTTKIDTQRAARIPELQRAAREIKENPENYLDEEIEFAEGVDAVLSWLDGEQSAGVFRVEALRKVAGEVL